MGLGRGLANILTGGAVAMVDEAMAGYNRAKSQYDEYAEELYEKVSSISHLRKEIQKLHNYLSENESHISDILQKEDVLNQLSENQQKSIREYESRELSVTQALTDMSYNGNVTFGDADDGILSAAIVLASLAMPVIGAFAARSNAEDEVKKITKARNKLVKQINKTKKAIVNAANEESKLQLQQKMYESVRGAVGWYKKEILKTDDTFNNILPCNFPDDFAMMNDKEREKAKEVLSVFNRLANEYTENLKTTLNQPRTESSRNAREANSQLESKEKCLSALTKKLDSGRRKQLAKDALLDSLERNKNDVIETFRKDFEHYCECHIFCNVAGEWSEKKSKMQGEYYDLRNKYDLIRYGGDYIFQGETFYGFKDVYKDFFINTLHNNFSLENCTSNEIFLKLKEIIAKTFGISESEITRKTELNFDEAMLNAYEFLYAIEKEIGVSIPEEKISQFETAGDVLDFIKSEGK